MNKKYITTILIVSLFLTAGTPVFAIQDMKSNKRVESSVEKINIEWWEKYNDVYLEEYILKALNNNHDLKIATLKVEEAKQNVKLQFANELPSASVGVSPVLSKLPHESSTTGSFSVPMIVNYEADIFLKNHDKTKAKKKLYEVAKFNEKTAYIAISSQVGATYFNIVKLDKLIELQEEIIKDRKKIYELMQIRNNQGLTSTADLTAAEKAYVLANADLSDLQKAREIFLNSLAVLIGESPENIADFSRMSYDDLITTEDIPESISSDVITNRPDYLAAEKIVEKAGLDVRIAKKELLPSINIIGLFSFNSFSSGGGMGWENALMALAGSAMLDLFKGGSKIANLKLRKNYYEQSLENYFKTNLTAIQEVNDSLCSLKMDNDKHHKNLQSYKMQEKEYGFKEIKYSDGLISKLDLLQQKETLLTMNKMVVNSRIDYFINKISLYKATAGSL